MIKRKPILTISDLSPTSDPALQFAGSLAHVLTAELQVIHAVGLMRRPLRSVLPALHQLGPMIDAADQALITQIRRTVPNGIALRSPAVELDDVDSLVRRYAGDLDPMVIVAPHLWESTAAGGVRGAKSPFALSRRAPPTVVVRGERAAARDHVVVVSSVETFGPDVIEGAGRWAFWLERVYGSGRPSGPDFEVMLVDDEGPREAVADRVSETNADLIVVDRSIFGQPQIAGQVEGVMSAIVKQTIPIVLIGEVKQASVAQSAEQTASVAWA